MDINRITYEIYADEWLHGTLDPDTQQRMDAFLATHPDIHAELIALRGVALPPMPAVAFPDKQLLHDIAAPAVQEAPARKPRRVAAIWWILLGLGIGALLMWLFMPVTTAPATQPADDRIYAHSNHGPVPEATLTTPKAPTPELVPSPAVPARTAPISPTHRPIATSIAPSPEVVESPSAPATRPDAASLQPTTQIIALEKPESKPDEILPTPTPSLIEQETAVTAIALAEPGLVGDLPAIETPTLASTESRDYGLVVGFVKRQLERDEVKEQLPNFKKPKRSILRDAFLPEVFTQTR